LDEQNKKISKDIEIYYDLFPEERKLDKLKTKEKKEAKAKKGKSEYAKKKKE
jgi:hypothetical protein